MPNHRGGASLVALLVVLSLQVSYPPPPPGAIVETTTTLVFASTIPKLVVLLDVESTNPQSVVQEILLTLKTRVTALRAELFQLRETPPGVPSPPQPLVHLIQLNLAASIEQQVDTIRILFRVDRARLDREGVGPTQIRLFQLKGNQWLNLPTRSLPSTPTHYAYEATGSGASLFAIAGAGSAFALPPGGELIIAVIVAVLVAGFAVFLHFRREHVGPSRRALPAAAPARNSHSSLTTLRHISPAC